MKVWFDYQDGDDPKGESICADVSVCPRIGEKVGVRQPEPFMVGTDVYVLDTVVDVRHYALQNEVRCMTSSRP